jgi:hypothetical protein
MLDVFEPLVLIYDRCMEYELSTNMILFRAEFCAQCYIFIKFIYFLEISEILNSFPSLNISHINLFFHI